MFPLANHGPLALNSGVLDFFQTWISFDQDTYVFSYQVNAGIPVKEYWSSYGNRVPSDAGIWLAEAGFPAQVRHLFLSYSAANILCFCQFSPHWLDSPGKVAFAALGLLPTAGQIVYLKERFPSAKIHTLFDTGLIGRITDCKAALWLTMKDAAFQAEGNLVKIRFRRNNFSIPACAFSLNRFEKTTGLRSGIRTHKSKSGLGSYYEFYLNTL